jgi:2'-5' RNA ligase
LIALAGESNDMIDLVALDVAILPPEDISARAVDISASLPAKDFRGLRLDRSHLPHITLMQLFTRRDDLDRVYQYVDDVLRDRSPLDLRVNSASEQGGIVSLVIDKTPPLVDLHERIMEALRDCERLGGGTSAFCDKGARVQDVWYVSGYRLKSSLLSFAPHITLGHGSNAPLIEPFDFRATIVALCHLGKFCTCLEVFRRWTLR